MDDSIADNVLRQLGLLAPKELLVAWRTREPWAQQPDVYQLVSERFLQAGIPLVAYDVATEGVDRFPSDLKLRQQQAAALARSGGTARANEALRRLTAEGHSDEETLGLLARSYKDMALAASDATARQTMLRFAAEKYADAYRAPGATPWSGINAATLALLSGDGARARKLAEQVIAQCRDDLERTAQTGADPYWTLATVGEAELVRGNLQQAHDWYARAVQVAQDRWGDLYSTRRNAQLLLETMTGVALSDRRRLEELFRVPAVALFCGHMIDRPGRTTPRFPPELENAVKEGIRRELGEVDARFGFSSAACGSDLLFLEAMLERGGEVRIVLPYDREQFRAESVEFPGGRWGERFDSALAKAADVIVASPQRLGEGAEALRYANLLIHGLASLHARQIGSNLVPLAVWDGNPPDGPGGTAGQVVRWGAVGLAPRVIYPKAACSQSRPALIQGREFIRPPSLEGSDDTQIAAMLFADAAGFSRLHENQVLQFVRHFLGLVGNVAGSSRHRPILANTWGDGLFFVFEGVRPAGLFALELCQRIDGTDWAAFGLPADLNLRVSLHAGPVLKVTDPVTGRLTYMGAHVSRAARIEPVTPPGLVYASAPFAALAAADGVGEFVCEYVGQVPLAKGYGTFPMFAVCAHHGA